MGTPLYRQRDLSRNNLAAATRVVFIGYIEPPDLLDPNKLNQTVYNFLLRSIREDDAKNGELLKRYLQGTQDVWERIQDRIFEVKTLWDVSKIENALLKYLKNIVGWTTELEHIINRMEDDQLRRLIAVSVALWKTRGPEDIFEDLLRYLLQTRVYMTNWFDYRFILDETYFTLEEHGFDSWLLDDPEDGLEQYYSTLKIVDDGTLDRVLAKYLIKMLRSCGERIEVKYLKFIELFDTNGDIEQWATYSGSIMTPTALVVSDGLGSLGDSSSFQISYITSKDSFNWGDYMVSVKMRAETGSTGLYGLRIHSQDSWNSDQIPIRGNDIVLDVENNLIKFEHTTRSEQVSYNPWGILNPADVYDLTVRVTDVDGADKKYEIYLDGELVLTVIDDTYRSGYIGIQHEIDAVLVVDKVEVFSLPFDEEIIGINP